MWPSPLRNIRRSYRRFKYENQYDQPLLIFFYDTCISVTKVVLIAAALLVGWSYLSGWT